ncbi:MAG: hypothetical protein J6L81_00750 [Clostridia bacterium]|nr:hypothetical protein [Clostridia bacterium]
MNNNIENVTTTEQPAEQLAEVPAATAPADTQQNSAAATENHSMVNSAFGKGLAATILAWFPITSIIAIFLGGSATKLVKKLRDHATANGIKPSGKNIAAKILGMVGKIGGIAMTIFWVIYFAIMAVTVIMILNAEGVM